MRFNRLILGALLVVACNTPGAKTTDTAVRIPTDSSAYFRNQLQQLSAVSAAKDSLYRDLAETTKLMADINTELAKVKTSSKAVTPVVSPESPLAATPNDRAVMLERVKELTGRVRRSESRLASASKRLKVLMGDNDSLRTQLAGLQSTIADLQKTIDTQKASIASIEGELSTVKAANAQLAMEKGALTDTVRSMTLKDNTVYYIVGSKKELEQKGIIRLEGGTRFPLIFVRTGETMVPGADLKPSDFTPINKKQVSEIALPDPEKRYRIVSAQNLSFVDTTTRVKDKFMGKVRITSPDEFWSTSKFLIVVEN